MEYKTTYKTAGENNTNSNRTTMPKVKIPRFPIIIMYILLLGIYIYTKTPILNPIYKNSYFFIVINIAIILFLLFMKKLNNKKVQNLFKTFFSVAIILYIVLNVISSPIINSNKYYNLVGDIKSYDYSNAKDEIQTDKIPVVDHILAERLGDKVLGADLGLGSQYEIGEYYLISTPKDLAWVAPLEPQNIFKWLQNQEGAPGYIYVSATNPNDVRLVKDVDGKSIKLKYTDKSFFNHDIKRYTYLQGNFTRGLEDYSFEIDDKGNPYWVVTIYEPTIGFSGEDVSGIVVIDAQTGENKKYNIGDKNIPDWVDRVYPKDMVQRQLEYYGAYKNGWLNTVTSQKEMITPTEGISYMFVKGKPYFYTGMTSIKADESTVGFMLHSTTNKETLFFKVNGATETAAKKSAEGKVQQYSYTASSPILLNIYQKPTYFMTLKDEDGLVKKYSFVSVDNYNVVGIGDSVDSAKSDYYKQLKENNVLVKKDLEEQTKTSQISRINQMGDYYYFTLEKDNSLYMVDKKVSNKLILTKPEDIVNIKYIEDQASEYIEVTAFENKSF